MKRLTLYIFLFLTCLITAAQDSATVHLKGRVIDEKGEPVSACVIRVKGQLASTVANLKGEYKLSFKSADSVVITYSMLTFRTRQRVLVKPHGNLTLNVTMYDDGKELKELEVKEIKRQLNETQELNTTEINRMPSNTGNAVEDLVASQAGVSQHNELSSQYNVRGGSFDENCVYINGAEVYRPLLLSSGQQEGLSVINPNMVEKVRFSAGGFEAKYGDKMSSVLDITYHRPTKWEGNVSGSMLGATAYMGYGNKKFSISHGLRYKTNTYMLGALQDDSEYKPNFVDYQAFLTWTPAKDWDIEGTVYISQNSYKFTPKTRETNFGTLEQVQNFKVYFDGWEQDLFQTFYGTISAKRTFKKYHSIKIGYCGFTTRERETYDIQGQYWLYNTSENEQLAVGTYMNHARNTLTSSQHTLSLNYEYKKKNHNVLAGLLYRHQNISENSREWEYRDSSGYSMPHNPERLEVIYSLKSHNTLNADMVEMYLQDTWRHETKGIILSFNYGARLSYWNFNRETLFSPRASIGIIPKANENFTFRLATGLYYQRPFYKELRDTVTENGLTTVQLNRNIKSQRSFQVIAGMEYRFKMAQRPFMFSTEVYYKLQDRLNPYTLNNTKIVYYGENCADGYVVGADFKLYGEFVEGADSWICFSLMRARMNINGVSVPQPTDQTWSLNMFFTDFFPGSTRWKLNLKAAFAGGLPFGAPHMGLDKHVFRAQPYKRVDVGMTYRALKNEDRHLRHCNAIKNIWLGLDCLNIFGFDNTSGYYWVTDNQNQQFAVPNYLTGRLFNFHISIDF